MSVTKSRLNLWHRLGLVLTVVWTATQIGIWLRPIQECMTGAAFWACDFLAEKMSNPFSSMFWAFPAWIGLSRLGIWGNALFAVVIFPALLWLCAFAVINVVRWICAGREISN